MSMTKQTKRDEPEPEARRLRRELFDDEMLDQLMAATDERGRVADRGGRVPAGDDQGGPRAGHGGRADRAPGLRARATRPVAGRRTPATGPPRRRWAPRSATSRWTSPRDRQRHVRAAAGAQGRPPPRRAGRHDHLPVRRRDDDPRHPAPPGRARWAPSCPTRRSPRSPTRSLEEVKAWQTRPLEAFYPIIYLDALVVKVRDGAHVRNKAAHIAVGVDMDGIKHVLGIWVQASEGAKFWAGVCAELANRGVRDVLIVCCDGLTGFPEAIEATWPQAIVQTCMVHLIRASMRFVSYSDRKAVAATLRPIYTAATVDAARAALADVRRLRRWASKYPAAVATWENAWERFIPFLAFPPGAARRSSTPPTRSSR